jgi:4-methylaminobutanoate oxidase (formaldehyde-forming)
VLSGLTPADLDDAAFPFLTSRETTVGDVPVRASRVTFTGELGWELYASTEYGAALWRCLWDAGQELGMLAAGYRAIDSLRLEKGYRVWGAEVTPEITPYEAGLGFCVRLDKPGGFLGAEALREAARRGPDRLLCCLVLDGGQGVPLGNEPVRAAGGPVVGRVTSGGYGYTVRAAIAYSHLPPELSEPGTPIEIGITGEWVGGTVAAEPLYDAAGSRIRAG